MLASLISCHQAPPKEVIDVISIPPTVERIDVKAGQKYKFDNDDVWFRAKRIEYLNIKDSTLTLPHITVKTNFKGGHLEPYNVVLTIMPGDSSSK